MQESVAGSDSDVGRTINGFGSGRVGGQFFSCDLPVNLAGGEHRAQSFHFSVLPLGRCTPSDISSSPLLNCKQRGQLLATALEMRVRDGPWQGRRRKGEKRNAALQKCPPAGALGPGPKAAKRAQRDALALRVGPGVSWKSRHLLRKAGGGRARLRV